MPRKPVAPKKYKYVVTLSVESPTRWGKDAIKLLVRSAIEEAAPNTMGEAVKVRVRAVDFD